MAIVDSFPSVCEGYKFVHAHITLYSCVIIKYFKNKVTAWKNVATPPNISHFITLEQLISGMYILSYF